MPETLKRRAQVSGDDPLATVEPVCADPDSQAAPNLAFAFSHRGRLPSIVRGWRSRSRCGRHGAFWGPFLLTVALGVPSAQAATPEEVAALQAQPCPEYRVIKQSTHSEERIAAARDGSFVVAGGFPPTELVPPVDWTQDPYGDRNWTGNLHSLGWLDQILTEYAREGDTGALEQARDLVLDWVSSNPLGQPGTAAMAWSDHAGHRAGYLGYVMRAAACESLLSDSQAAELIDSTRVHAELVGEVAQARASNHGLSLSLGLYYLGDYAQFLDESSAWRSAASQRFYRVLHDRLEEDEGVWLEHSSAYQFAIIGLVERFAGLPGTTGFGPELAAMRDAASWFVTPANELAAFGELERPSQHSRLGTSEGGQR